MERRLQAVYKNGVLRPLEPLSLENNQQVTVTISEPSSVAPHVAGYCSPEEWAEASRDEVSVEEVRRALSTLTGSLADAITSLRQER